MQAMEIDANRAAATQTLRFALSPAVEPIGEKIRWNVPSAVQSASTLEIVEHCTAHAMRFSKAGRSETRTFLAVRRRFLQGH
jgi:hypothetical protein